MRISYSSVVILLSVCWICKAVPHNRVTNEDIRDAILSVVNMIRSTEDKLERHEYRERVLGDQIKKSLIALDKRIKALDQGTLSRIDERIATIESMWIQKDEKEKQQMQKTFEVVEDIQKNLPTIMEKLKSDIINEVKQNKVVIPQPQESKGFTKENMDAIEKLINTSVVQKIKHIEDAMKNISKDVESSKIQQDKVQQLNQQSNDNLEKLKNHLANNENLLEKYESKLAEYHNRVDVFPQKDKDHNDYNTNIMQVLDVQKSNVEQILSEVKTIVTKVVKIPEKLDFETGLNTTLSKIESLHHDIGQQSEKEHLKIEDKMKELQRDSENKHADVTNNFNDVNKILETLTDNLATSYNVIKSEVKSLGKLEQVMVQTADGVLDTKRRVEYGVHQILLEVGDLIKSQSKEVNSTINDRFNNFELSILDNETGALANLTIKIGDEIDQVWRQIGIMHQQMSASTDTLNKLQNQTDAYVNGSLNVMDSMKGKVVKITDRMTEVDDNLNYLMGRLSLVTQEFNMIKNGLGKALDEIRASFQEVQDKVKDKGPGPHKIEDNEVESTTKT